MTKKRWMILAGVGILMILGIASLVIARNQEKALEKVQEKNQEDQVSESLTDEENIGDTAIVMAEEENDELLHGRWRSDEDSTVEPEPVSEPESEPEPVSEPEPEPEPEMNYQTYSTGDSQLDSKCDAILDQILTADMSDNDQLWAVYQWTSKSIRYQGGTPFSDWIQIAKTAIDERSGNCYAFCCTSKALLTRLGYATQLVERSDQEHYWDLVQVNGNWYHFDTTPGWGAIRFLWTDQQMLDYRYDYAKGQYLNYFWDQTKYPATPKELYTKQP